MMKDLSVLVVVASLVFLLQEAPTAEAWAPGDSTPNIVYILADDLGKD